MNNPFANAYYTNTPQPVPVPVAQMAPQGLFGDIVSAVAPVAGTAIGNAFGQQQLGSAIGNVAGHLGGLIPFSAGPGQIAYAHAPAPVQYAPQGLFGDILSKVAPVAGTAIGNAFGQQQLGSAIGNVAGHLGGLIPFSAGPGQIAYAQAPAPVQYAPQGLFGDILGTVAPIAGNVLGGVFGQPQLGATIGNVAGQAAKLLPFSAGPGQIAYAPAPVQYAPQGLFGDILGAVAPVAGNVLGGVFGQPQLGSTIGNVAGQAAKLLPFSAGPGQIAYAHAPAPIQYAPQGLFGDIVSAVAPVAGTAIGSAFGQKQIGSSIGNLAGHLGGLIPFSAGPGQIAYAPVPAQLAPQGLFGDILGTVAPIAGNVLGGVFGQPQLGATIGNVAGQAAKLLPFSAGPGQIAYAPAPAPVPAQFAPQGLFGDILGAVAPIAGAVLGGIVGQPILGGMAGSAAGQAAKLIPFSAGPGQVYGLPYASYAQPQQQFATLH